MPYEIAISDHFAAAHFLDGYEGKCENVHGHNFVVNAVCRVEETDAIGIGIDFKILKQHLGAITSQLDHINLNEFSGLEGQNPTAENLARYIYYQLSESLKATPAEVDRVTIFESDKYSATYFE